MLLHGYGIQECVVRCFVTMDRLAVDRKNESILTKPTKKIEENMILHCVHLEVYFH